MGSKKNKKNTPVVISFNKNMEFDSDDIVNIIESIDYYTPAKEKVKFISPIARAALAAMPKDESVVDLVTEYLDDTCQGVVLPYNAALDDKKQLAAVKSYIDGSDGSGYTLIANKELEELKSRPKASAKKNNGK